MNERKPIDATAASTMVALCCVWGPQQVAIKLAAPDMAPVLQVGLRPGTAALILLLVVFLRRKHHALWSGNWRPDLFAGVLFGLEFVLIAQGLRFTSASHMSIFLYTAPIFAALDLHLRLVEERLAPLQWIGIVIAFAGIILTFSGRDSALGGDAMRIGDLLGIAAGAVWGATTLVVRTTRLVRAPAAVTLWYQLMGACVLGIGSAIAFGETPATLTLTLLASLAYQTVVLSAASYLMFQLCQPGAGDTPQRRFLQNHGEGVFHTGFSTDDLRVSRGAAEALGLGRILSVRLPGRGGSPISTRPTRAPG